MGGVNNELHTVLFDGTVHLKEHFCVKFFPHLDPTIFVNSSHDPLPTLDWRYNVNWTASAYLDWGRGAGCALPLQTCTAFRASTAGGQRGQRE